MGLDVRVSGADQIHALAKHFKELEKAGLGRQMARALTKAVDPIGKAVTAEAAKVAPSGYEGTLTRSLKHRRSVRSGRTEASVRLTTSARGRKDLRDLPSLNAGKLRHPVFKRFRTLKSGEVKRNPWAVTTIPSGFYDRGTKTAADAAEKQLQVVIDDFTQRLIEE